MKYHGKGGVVYLAASGTGTATVVLGLNHWTLNRQSDKVETTEFGAANKTYVKGYADTQGTLSGFWRDDEDKLFSGADSDDGVLMYLYPSKDAPSKFAAGPAWLDVSMDVATNGSVTVNGPFSANGDWTINL